MYSNKKKKNSSAAVPSIPTSSATDFQTFVNKVDVLDIETFFDSAATSRDGANLKFLWKRAFEEGRKVKCKEEYTQGYNLGYGDGYLAGLRFARKAAVDEIEQITAGTSATISRHLDIVQQTHRSSLGMLPLILPQELIDQVIDHLHKDPKALKVCALVCKAWVPSSRCHLFHTIQLSYILNATQKKLIPLIALLHHPDCSFATSISSLQIFGGEDDGYGMPYYAYGWLDRLIQHLPKFTSLTTLYCHQISNHNTSDSWKSILKIQEFTARIRDMTLEDAVFNLFSEFMTSVSSFPSLVMLTCVHSELHDYDMETALVFTERPPKSLRVLDILDSPLELNITQLMLGWLVRSQTALHTIKVRGGDSLVLINPLDSYVGAAKFAVLASYFRFLASSLEVLEILSWEGEICEPLPSRELIFKPRLLSGKFIENTDIHLNTGIQILEIKSFSENFSKLPRFFRGVSGVALTAIKFSNLFSTNEYDPYPTEIWSAIDEELSSFRFSHLKKLEFKLSAESMKYRGSRDGIKLYLIARLTRCIKRNIEVLVVPVNR